MRRAAAVLGVLLTFASSSALAQSQPPPQPTAEEKAKAEEQKKKAKEPKQGDFDAGGQIRLPSGPDEDGEFATFNWIALDLEGRYHVLGPVAFVGYVPLAVWKPDTIAGGAIDPKLVGGMTLSLEAIMKSPVSNAYDARGGIVLTGGYLREGAFLLSKKDYPLFVGDFKPGFGVGLPMLARLSSVFDFSMTPSYVHQSGTDEGLDALQLPTSIVLKMGEVVKLSADLGIYTGDDFSFRGSNGGRTALGASLTVKIGSIVALAGAGLASLQTGGLYPSARDSLYIDLNVKYAK
ncbi:MAG TPA: hypothetical protein VMZ28_31540 [Kofleriaceae bacterium]|nr:hypothetical protein [Kofleriaceae bacterium]